MGRYRVARRGAIDSGSARDRLRKNDDPEEPPAAEDRSVATTPCNVVPSSAETTRRGVGGSHAATHSGLPKRGGRPSRPLKRSQGVHAHAGRRTIAPSANP